MTESHQRRPDSDDSLEPGQSVLPGPHRPSPVSFWFAFAPVLCLIVLLVGSVWLFGDDAIGGPSQVALMLAGFVAAGFALISGSSWAGLEDQVLRSTGYVTQAILILLLVGGLIGTWILGGIVPTLIVWGLRLLSPEVFLAAAVMISALVSLATGSSWSTAGTLGLALVGIGNTMQIDPAMSAGAVISGAYFGDKMSPFSETTNLASSMVGVDLFVHIRHMFYTTVPGVLITICVFLLIGVAGDTASGYDPARIENVITGIERVFDTSPVMLLPPLILFVLVARRMPAIPALMVGLLLGVVFALLFQPAAIGAFMEIPSAGALTGGEYMQNATRAAGHAAATGYVARSGVAEVDSLLSRGGMSSMLTTIWLILSAMFFSGIMEGSGFLQRIAAGILRFARGTGHLIAASLGTSLFLNFTASDQYLSLVVTGRMYREAFTREGLEHKNLSRALEDSGTLTSALVPWNTCGAFMASTLGVATLSYLPYAVLNWTVPLISLAYGYLGYSITRIPERDPE
ncbi:MAG: Na+/H+ antiporter NhaC [Leptospirales bacterium]|jgi:NhaC family Na+:H+ antiporter